MWFTQHRADGAPRRPSCALSHQLLPRCRATGKIQARGKSHQSLHHSGFWVSAREEVVALLGSLCRWLALKQVFFPSAPRLAKVRRSHLPHLSSLSPTHDSSEQQVSVLSFESLKSWPSRPIISSFSALGFGWSMEWQHLDTRSYKRRGVARSLPHGP